MTTPESDLLRAIRREAQFQQGDWGRSICRRVDALGVAVRPEGEALRLLELARMALGTIERRLREDAAPLAALVKAAGDAASRRAWKAVYSSAVHAQGALSEIGALLAKGGEATPAAERGLDAGIAQAQERIASLRSRLGTAPPAATAHDPDCACWRCKAADPRRKP